MNRHRKTRIALALLGAVALIAAFGAVMYAIEHHGDKHGHSALSTQNQEFFEVYDKKYYIDHNLDAYLLIGTDDTGKAKTRKTGKFQGGMADFLLLFVMDKSSNEYRLLQIDRNTVTDVHLLTEDGKDGDWDEEQICTAHWYGTSEEQCCENTVMTVSDFLWDLPIDGYYSINMGDIKRLNQAVGGVKLTIQEDLTKVDPAFRKGAALTLTDAQAEKFVRARMHVGDESNVSRMERQRQYMDAFKSQVRERSTNDPAFINDLFNQLREVSATDIPGNRVSAIANFVYKAEDGGTYTFKGKTKEGYVLGDGVPHEEFYPNEKNTIEVLKTICGIEG